MDMQSDDNVTNVESKEREGTPQTSMMKTTKRSNNRYLVRLGAVALIVAATLPFIQTPISTESNAIPSIGVDSRAVPVERKLVLETRADSPTDVCTRWSHQSAVINGTLYVYGGQATTEPGQTQNKWSRIATQSLLWQLLNITSRQRLPIDGSHQKLADLQPFPDRPTTTIRPPERVKRLLVELPRVRISLWRRVFRQPSRFTNSILALGIQCHILSMDRTSESNNFIWRQRSVWRPTSTTCR